jgi:hypothetical protein
MLSKKSILYFLEPGGENTAKTLKVAKERADELGIRDIVVSTTLGGTGVKAVDVFKGYNVVVVTHSTGFKVAGVQELSDDNAMKIRAGGGKILTGTHVFMGVNRAIQRKFDTVYPSDIIAQTLRFFGQGMKVVVETAAMAADAGLIPMDNEVVVVAGSHRGADTAVIIKPANSFNIFDLEVREIICKPRNL